MPVAPIPRRAPAALAALLCAGALAAGCGGGDPGERPAARADEDLTAFTECMRRQGVELPDADASSRGTTIRIPEGLAPEQLASARGRCEQHLPKLAGTAPDPVAAAEVRDRAVRFAACMRREGVDFPDPQVHDGRVVIAPGRAVDPDDPATRRAQIRCGELMPGAPGR